MKVIEEQYQKIADNTFDKFIVHNNGRISLKILPSKRDLPIIDEVTVNDDKIIKIVIKANWTDELSQNDIIHKNNDTFTIFLDFNDKKMLEQKIDNLILFEKKELSNSLHIPEVMNHNFKKRIYDFCKRIINNYKGAINTFDVGNIA